MTPEDLAKLILAIREPRHCLSRLASAEKIGELLRLWHEAMKDDWVTTKPFEALLHEYELEIYG